MDQPHATGARTPTRRAVLAGSGAGAALAVLAACGGDPPAGTQDGADTSEEGGGSAVVEPGQVLTGTDDVPVGGALAVTVAGAKLLVTQPEEGTFAAFSAICTHQGCTVGPGEGELRCPCHASRFDLATGDVLGGPAPSPLPEVAVTVDGGDVVSA